MDPCDGGGGLCTRCVFRPVFPSVSLLPEVTKGETKLWFNFIERFLSTVSKNAPVVQNVVGTISIYCQFSNDFIALANSTNRNYASENITLDSVSGYLIYSYIPSFFETHRSHFPWTLHLDHHLRMNFTACAFYFSSETKYCILNRLCVLNSLHFSVGTDLCFCGRLSKFSFFPKFPKMLFMISKDFLTIFHFAALFCATDSGNVVSYGVPSGLTSLGPEFLELSFTFNRGDQILVFVIQVKKMMFILFHSIKFEYVLHDGPDVHSKIVSIKGSHARTSTFQCIILVHTGKSNNTISYSPKFHNFTQTVHKVSNADEMSSLPNCVLPACFLVLVAEQNHNIKVAVTNFIYKGKQNQACLFGGFVAGEVLTDEHVECSAICRPFNASPETGKSFYSAKSSLILMSYTYIHLSQITVNFTMSLSACQAVHIDLCKLMEFCGVNQSPRDCDQYTKFVTRNTDLKLELNNITGIFPLLVKQQFSFERYQRCTVFHFASGESFMDCGATFVQQYYDANNPLYSADAPQDDIKYEIRTFQSVSHHETTDVVTLGGGEVKELCLFVALPNATKRCISRVAKVDLNIFNKNQLSQFVDREVVVSDTIVTVSMYQEQSIFVVLYSYLPGFHLDFIFETNSIPFHERRKYGMVNSTLSAFVPKGTADFSYSTDMHLAQWVFWAFVPDEYSRTKMRQFEREAAQRDVYIQVHSSLSDLTGSIINGFLHWGFIFRMFLNMPFRMFAQQYGRNDPLIFQKNSGTQIFWEGLLYFEPILPNFQQYFHLLSTQPHTCYSHAGILTLCLEIPLNQSRSQNSTYFVMSGGTQQAAFGQNVELVSWTKAKATCGSVGAYLPYFVGLQHVEELVALLLLSPYLTPIEAIFIGLEKNKHRMVSETFIPSVFFINTNGCVLCCPRMILRYL